MLTPPDVFGMTTSGLDYGEVDCWIIRAARYWLRVASTSLAIAGFIRWGREVTGALPSGREISKGIREQDPKSVFKVETHREIRTAHHTVAQWPGGSSQGHVSQTQSPAGGAAAGPRCARTNKAGPGSIVPVAPASAASRPRLPHLCQANLLQLKPGSPQTGQGGVPQRGWRVAMPC